MTNFKLVTAVSALAALASVSASGSIVSNLDITDGSEAVLTIVNNANLSSIYLDLGFQRAAFVGPGGSLVEITPAEGTYLFGSPINSFISGAGGLGGVSFSIVAGGLTAAGGSFIQTSANAALASLPNTAAGKPLNTIRTTWNDMLSNLITPLNTGDPSATTVNNSYPKIDDGNGSYDDIGGGFWGGATSGANANFLNLVLGTGTGSLFAIDFTTTASGRPTIADTGKFATLTSPSANAYQLNLLPQGTAVPAPGAVWLLGTALGALGLKRGRQAVRKAASARRS